MRRPIAIAALLAPSIAQAQAYRCAVPARIDRPRPEQATAKEPQRLLPIGGYTLALTWAPEYCKAHGREPSARLQCGGGNRFGFTLHGLWPDGIGKEWPQYCATAAPLPPRTIRDNLCATPSPHLMQHEWAKHGTCMPGLDPARYFARSTGLFAKLRYPDMDALSRQQVDAGALAKALADTNPGLPAESVRVTVNRNGWLDELWLCLDTRFRYVRCRADSGGVAGNAGVKIWRGRR